MAEQTSENPLFHLLVNMASDSLDASSLDPETLMLVRLGALVAVDGPTVSYLLNLEAASEVGVDAEQVRGVLAAIAPVVGTPRVVSAAGQIVDALDIELGLAELEQQARSSNAG